MASTYQEAEVICSEQGLRLCARNEKLSDVCCGTGCTIDNKIMWIADDTIGKLHMLVNAYWNFIQTENVKCDDEI